jgi:hypothetical protein
MWRFGNAEGDNEDAYWGDGAQSEDDGTYEDVVGDCVVQHAAGRRVVNSPKSMSWDHLV